MRHALVWFKRDLRLEDHEPLSHAQCAEQLLCLYCYEPCVLDQPEHDPRHLDFVNQSLQQLERGLLSRGNRLVLRQGDAPAVFADLHRVFSFDTILSHEETGLESTYARDRAVKAWCDEHRVEWIETPRDGVVRRLGSRDGWASKWSARMNREPIPAPAQLPQPPESVEPGAILDAKALGITPSTATETQRGGRIEAISLLETFLSNRGVDYRSAMSSPVAGWDACSRLSPHFAFGTLSIREAHHATEAQRCSVDERVRSGEPLDRRWRDSLGSFAKRLRWQSHFIQKLEDEPQIEFRNFNRGYDGMRPGDDGDPDRVGPSWGHPQDERLERWWQGQTGYPFVDACMRCLHTTGWMNFRMRAMLASFASYHLWLHWRLPAQRLARLFTDFEPGIHFPQFQMQSGVTGINTVRIYNPIKQQQDQDPTGRFVRRWVPELEGVPEEHLAQPWKMPGFTQHMAGCVIGDHYPEPIVDHAEAYRFARDTTFAFKRSARARTEASKVYRRHGSRKRPRNTSSKT
ncbi:MAG: deoxyribodipyrimidine photo-lyase/cryptochrome family protein [Planctomycetota bacterium]